MKSRFAAVFALCPAMQEKEFRSGVLREMFEKESLRELTGRELHALRRSLEEKNPGAARRGGAKKLRARRQARSGVERLVSPAQREAMARVEAELERAGAQDGAAYRREIARRSVGRSEPLTGRQASIVISKCWDAVRFLQKADARKEAAR